MSYSPKIDAVLVRQLYLLKHSMKRKIPMTKMVDSAVSTYLMSKLKEKSIIGSKDEFIKLIQR